MAKNRGKPQSCRFRGGHSAIQRGKDWAPLRGRMLRSAWLSSRAARPRLPRRPESPLFGVDPNTVGFSLLRRMEEIAAIAQVIGTIKKPPTSRKNRFEGPVYLIKAKIYLPPNKYLNDLFRVSVCEPIDLAKGPPAVMEHGIFTFDSCQKLKVGKLLGIIVSPA